MTIKRTPIEGNVVLQVAGRMDAESAPEFERECEACIAEGNTNLVADLSALTYVSSMGLRSFMVVGKKVRGLGGELRICRLTGLVRQVFEITGINLIFPLYESLESALAKG